MGIKNHRMIYVRPSTKKGTFNKILSNIQKMAKSLYDFECVIRLNVSDSNFDDCKDFMLNNATPIFCNDKWFSFHFHPIWGKPDLVLTQKSRIGELTDFAMQLGIGNIGESDFTLNEDKENVISNVATKKGRT